MREEFSPQGVYSLFDGTKAGRATQENSFASGGEVSQTPHEILTRVHRSAAEYSKKNIFVPFLNRRSERLDRDRKCVGATLLRECLEVEAL